ncbi:MAG: transporter, family, multidrug resistance protein [Solirubrobacteraceae bacterium]|jgi:DHA1 family bicyclomycin/chloramphenicol resistance-like MFS transporter|nr:transporter, family, multidrug resistance protein [Solirubrobacteraceae bacterium]
MATGSTPAPGNAAGASSPTTEKAGETPPGARASTVRLIVVLGSVNAVGPLSIDMYLPALPEIAGDLHASATQIQLTLTACVVGLALGQLVIGPLSDRLGRRLPLIAAMSTYALASVLCALAPSAPALMALRLVQGLAGAGGVVIARAVVRDLHSGVAAVRLFSSLMLVTGLAPILAPLAGAQVLSLGSWRGIFVALGVVSALITVVVAVGLRETLPPERRTAHGLRRTLQTMRGLLRERWFVGHGLASGLAFGALFAYIGGSSFVLQGIYGVSPQLYSLLFAMNGLGLIAGSQVNARLVGRFGPALLLRRGLTAIAVSASTLLGVVLVGGLGVWAVLVPMFVIVSSLSFVLPNATALALVDHATVAGTASAVLGVIQFLVGAVLAPVVGVGGTSSAVPMAAVMTAAALGALVAHRAAGGRQPWRRVR